MSTCEIAEVSTCETDTRNISGMTVCEPCYAWLNNVA